MNNLLFLSNADIKGQRIVDPGHFLAYSDIYLTDTENRESYRFEEKKSLGKIYLNLMNLPQSIEGIKKRQHEFKYFIDNSEIGDDVRAEIEVSKRSFPKFFREVEIGGQGTWGPSVFEIPLNNKKKEFKDDYLKFFEKILKRLPSKESAVIDSLRTHIESCIPTLERLSLWKVDDLIFEKQNRPYLALLQVDPVTNKLNTVELIGFVDNYEQLQSLLRKRNGNNLELRLAEKQFSLEIGPNVEFADFFNLRNAKLKQVYAKFNLYEGLEEEFLKLKLAEERVNELLFYCQVGDYYRELKLSKIPFVFPEILSHEEKLVDVRGFIPMYLKTKGKKLQEVDIFSNPENIVQYITGLNSRGKSSYLRNMALVHMHAQAGFPITARSARVSMIDKILAYETVSDNYGRGESRFRAEVKAMKTIYQQATSRSLVLLDEPFTSTDTTSSVLAIQRCIEYSTGNKISTLVSSHNQEAAKSFQLNPNVNLLKVNTHYGLERGIGESHGELILDEENFLKTK